ncbi:MAG: histidine--tRNA ligase [Tenericutes bacterium]|nr:MAG: histidine--tRNA ligase [Mycoplasmatota bacterium]
MNRPKGTKDIYGDVALYRRYVESVLESIANVHGYQYLETPIFERKEVFVKSVGETTDIIGKEMYEFKDRKGREMVLRPEGTAGAIRAIVENKLYIKLPFKAFYKGQMFRYENPQKGRQRQFSQFGVEVIGEKDPYLDAEVIMMANMIIKSFDIKAKLYINSIGDRESRKKYSDALKEYFNNHKDTLTKDSIARIDKNPMRILDDKIDSKKDVVKNAPKISEFLSDQSIKYFKTLQDFLTKMSINFTVDETIVRGLDYYSETTFEFKSLSDQVGSQDTLIGGGRYESLVKDFGGPEVGGVGFALGIERIVNEVKEKIDVNDIRIKPNIFVLNIDKDSKEVVASIVYMLRLSGYQTD